MPEEIDALFTLVGKLADTPLITLLLLVFYALERRRTAQRCNQHIADMHAIINHALSKEVVGRDPAAAAHKFDASTGSVSP